MTTPKTLADMTPERPGKDDLQARYGEAQEQTSTPRTVATEAEYAALPIGSIASKPDTPCSRHAVFKKIKKNKWERTGDNVHMSDRHMAQMELPVLRYGRGDEEVEP